MSKQRSKNTKQWNHHIVKIKPGGIAKGTYLQKWGVPCNTWPTGSATLYYDSHDGNYELIDYYIKNQPYVDQPCEHIKNSVKSYQMAGYTLQHIVPDRCDDGTYKKFIQTAQPIGDYYHWPLPPSPRFPDIPDLSQSHREALTFFASGCQPITANFAVNLFEFKELIDLAMNAADALLLFKKLAGERLPYSWGMFLRKLSRLDPAQRALFISNILSKEAANAFLAYSFAIAPLLSDIKSCADYLSSLSTRIAFFRKNNKTPVRVRFSSDLTNAYPIESISYPPVTANDWQWGPLVARTYYRAIYTATAWATYDVSGLKDNDVAYSLAKKAFGFSDPLVFLYEVTPFSFVLDWVAKVGDYIASLPSKAIFPYVLSTPIHSIKIDQTNTYAFYTHAPAAHVTPAVITEQIVHTDIINYYKRSIGIPLTFSGLDTSLPGVHELMLALSLGRQIFK